MTFTEKQNELLSEPILAKNVKERDGNSAGTFQLAYVEGWHVIDEANRIFGYSGWTSETIETKLVAEEQKCISYIAKVRITVGDVVREGTGAGHGRFGTLGEKHESAIKEAETDARKRAFMQFGNQFGLSLYNGKDKSWKTNKPKVNTGEVIETLREQVSEVINPTVKQATTESEKTYELAVAAIQRAKTMKVLDDYKGNINERFRNGKLTNPQKVELERLITKKMSNLMQG